MGKVIITLLVLFWYIFLPIYIIYRWFRYGRDQKLVGLGEVRVWYNPSKTPDGKRFLTPAEVGVLGGDFYLACLTDSVRNHGEKGVPGQNRTAIRGSANPYSIH